MVRIAPRYDQRIIEAALALDDRAEPIAEICRRVAEHVEQLGITRPSSVHLRRLIRAERERQDEARARREELVRIAADVYYYAIRSKVVDAFEVAADVYYYAIRSKVVDAFEVAERVREAGR